MTPGLRSAAAALLCSASALAWAEDCADTTFSLLAASDCKGSFGGNINGGQDELDFLAAEFGGTWGYAGKSDDDDNGPFTGNPEVSTDGTLTLDAPITGTFVIGLKAGNNHSYYLFESATPITELTFDTTAGVATNRRGIPQDLSHANLYIGAVIPEPKIYALMLAGLGACAFVARRKRR